jgi:hypothetical protein
MASSIVAGCPQDGNATDCLLRALVAAVDKASQRSEAAFNWDPVTFGFTVAIALAAAGLALVTVLQAVLAAGPGNRKSNAAAIGPWASKTRWEWKFRHLSFLYQAETPVLTQESIMSYLVRREESTRSDTGLPSASLTVSASAFDGTVAEERYASIAERLLSLRAKSSKPPAATWLAYLDRAGLGNIHPSRFSSTKTIIADYVPSDLIAVPAYAQVGLIVVTMAASGAKIQADNQSRYPVITGSGYQFEFRQHPSLGVVGWFSDYQFRQRTPKAPSEEMLRYVMGQSRGYVELGIIETSARSGRVRITAAEDETAQRLISDHHKSCNYCLDACSSTTSYLRPGSVTLFAFLNIRTPWSPPTIFPTGELVGFELLPLLALQSRFWMTEISPGRMAKKSHAPNPMYATQGPTCPLDRQSAMGFIACPCHQIFKACERLLNGPAILQDFYASLLPTQQQLLRFNVLQQIGIVDSWLQAQPEQNRNILCKTIFLYETTNKIHDAFKTATGHESPFWKLSVDQVVSLSSFIEIWREADEDRAILVLDNIWSPDYSRKEKTHGIQYLMELLREFVRHKKYKPTWEDELVLDVLIWRSLLAAVLFCTAPDKHRLVVSGVWEQVIPIL